VQEKTSRMSITYRRKEIKENMLHTQIALVRYVSMLLLNPAFLPFGVTRLYTHSRSHTFVFMFQESMSTLKFSGTSIFHTSTFAAPFQVGMPEGPLPVKPSPVRMLAPSVKIHTP
jgi:hypothetical protein